MWCSTLQGCLAPATSPSTFLWRRLSWWPLTYHDSENHFKCQKSTMTQPAGIELTSGSSSTAIGMPSPPSGLGPSFSKSLCTWEEQGCSAAVCTTGAGRTMAAVCMMATGCTTGAGHMTATGCTMAAGCTVGAGCATGAGCTMATVCAMAAVCVAVFVGGCAAMFAAGSAACCL